MAVLLRSLSIALLLLSTGAYAQSKKIKTDWLVVYYMPYDNNLSDYGKGIIKSIKDSITSDNVVVTIQADLDDTSGITRYIITRSGIQKTLLSNEESARTQTYEHYLLWVNSQVSYKKLAVVFLDHGGRLNELCLDEYPTKGYLKVDSLKQVFKRVYKSKKIDLLFLQVCTKGSVEPTYELKDAAKYTLCSQFELGAPNYYYHDLFSALSHSRLGTGLDVAHYIVTHERDNMYNSYTLLDNAKFDSLYTLLRSFVGHIEPLTGPRLLSHPLSIYYSGEPYWDIISLLENLDLDKHPRLNIERTNLIRFIFRSLITSYTINPTRDIANNYCGLSISAVTDTVVNYNHFKLYPLLARLRGLKVDE